MSGGTYDHLHAAPFPWIVENITYLVGIRDRLQKQGHRHAADELTIILAELKAIEIQLEAPTLREVLRCVEYEASNDYLPEQVSEACAAHEEWAEG